MIIAAYDNLEYDNDFFIDPSDYKNKMFSISGLNKLLATSVLHRILYKKIYILQ